jgi:hypothetical protein
VEMLRNKYPHHRGLTRVPDDASSSSSGRGTVAQAAAAAAGRRANAGWRPPAPDAARGGAAETIAGDLTAQNTAAVATAARRANSGWRPPAPGAPPPSRSVGGGGEQEEWEEVQDEASGKSYWRNRKNGNSMWTRPGGPDGVVGATGAEGPSGGNAVATEGHDDVVRNKVFARRARRQSKAQPSA